MLLGIQSKALASIRVTSPELVRVISSWLVIFGVALSTVSAQSNSPLQRVFTCVTRHAARRSGSGCQEASASDDSDCLPIASSYSRYSSEKQSETSITDQQRICRERADHDGFRILSQFEFSDEAVSGTKRKRDGLDRMLADAERGEFQVLYFHSLSRLARESVISMPILKTLVYTYDVRFISVSEGVDSAQLGWETNATFICLHHEMFIRDLSANVLKGQIGAVLSGFSVGDYPFGYHTVPSPNGQMVGHGRNAKPRMVYRIQTEQADVVRQVFQWFVHERKGLAWIVRELNRRRVPKDHRSSTPDWDRSCVIRMLRSAKYVGLWFWGRNKTRRDPLTGDKWQEPRPEEESAKWIRQIPDLRIVEDESYFEAQRLLNENNERVSAQRDKNGRLHGSKKGSRRNHLLSGLIKCEECGSTFHVGGPHGKYLFCPKARKGTCCCRTTLNRARAERMILEVIGQRLLADKVWIQAVVDATVAAWHENQQARPDETIGLRQEIQEVERKIAKLLDQLEQDDSPAPEIRDRLTSRRLEKEKAERRLREVGAAPKAPDEPPTADWVREQLTKLAETVRGEPNLAREAILELLDCPIVVREIESSGKERKVLRGTFSLPASKTLQAIADWHREETAEPPPDQVGEVNESLVIDFRDQSRTDEQGDEAWGLYNQDLPHNEIARRIGCDRSQLTKILRHAAKKRGVELEDGRARRARLKHGYSRTLYNKLIEPAMELWNQDLLLHQIAERLKVDPATATKAIKSWHDCNGVPMPDCRTRRMTLTVKTAPHDCPLDEGTGSVVTS